MGISNSGTNGDDTLIGTGGNDTLIGYSGNDVFISRSGNDFLYGGLGHDLVKSWGSYTDFDIRIINDTQVELISKTYFDAGTDTLVGIERIQFISGGIYDIVTGRDEIIGGDPIVGPVPGKTPNYYLTSGSYWSIIIGDSGNDTLVGKDGFFDTLYGGNGNDVLAGGVGKDILTGGTGADRFVFNSVGDGVDIITDFNSAESDLIVIDFVAVSGNPGSVVSNDFSFNSSNSTLSYKQNPIAILQGVTTFDVANSLDIVPNSMIQTLLTNPPSPL